MAARGRRREPDPPELLAELERSLADGPLPRGAVLRGEERFFRERAIDLLRTRAAREGFETCLHDAERGNPDFRLAALVDDLSGGGLFAARRLVVVRNGAELLKKAGTKDSPLTTAILAFLASPEDPGTVVLSLPSLRADHAVAKAVKAAGGPLLDLRKLWDAPPPWSPDPRQAELVRWLGDHARRRGVRLTPEQAVYVATATGNDLFALDAQVERLAAMPGDALREVVGWSAATAPWSVADHLVAGDVARALAGVEVLFRGGFQEKTGRRLLDPAALSAMLVGSLSRGVRRAFAVAEELARGRSEGEAARAVGAAGRAATEAVGRARARPPAAWRRMLEDVADLERRAKSGGGVDASDFAVLARRWSLAPSRSAGR